MWLSRTGSGEKVDYLDTEEIDLLKPNTRVRESGRCDWKIRDLSERAKSNISTQSAASGQNNEFYQRLYVPGSCRHAGPQVKLLHIDLYLRRC